MPLSRPDFEFLQTFFRQLTLNSLNPDDPRYEPIYETTFQEQDPIALMRRGILFSGEEQPTQQLFSGYRGAGKSTELKRLKKDLEEYGHIVYLLDIEDYLDNSSPLDISSFLLFLCGAFSDALHAGGQGILPDDPARESYWDRFVAFLKNTRVEPTDLSAGLSLDLVAPPAPGGTTSPGKLTLGPQLKATLKTDPTFRQKLAEVTAGRLTAFVQDAHEFIADCARRALDQAEKEHGQRPQLVLLIDSIEHIRGNSSTDEQVQQSIVNLFSTHADKLKLPGLHVIYTIPPYLKLRAPGIEASYETGGLYLVYSLKICTQERHPVPASYEALVRIVEKRGDWRRLLGERQALDRLIRLSGGHLRDLFRMLQEIIRRTQKLPAPDATVASAINHVRSNMLPLADDDIENLALITESHQARIAAHDPASLARFARFLDTHLTLCYLNGKEWYDVHPLLREEVLDQAARLRTSTQSEPPRS